MDGWRTVHDAATRDVGLGVHLVDLPTDALPAGGVVDFTFRWTEVDRWEGTNFRVEVA
jgi:glucoamylase